MGKKSLAVLLKLAASVLGKSPPPVGLSVFFKISVLTSEEGLKWPISVKLASGSDLGSNCYFIAI